MISSGVALASHGELHFNLTGFLIQAGAVAVRIVALVARSTVFDARANSVRGVPSSHD